MAFESNGSSSPSGTAGAVCSTQKWLQVDGLAHQRWRLPDDTNLDFLEAQIKAAIRGGEAVTVETWTDTPSVRNRIVLNGRALPFVLLGETQDKLE